MPVTVRIGQEWQKCVYAWDMEKYIIISPLTVGTLILVNIDQDIGTGEMLYTPVHLSELNTYTSNSA